MKSGTKSVSRRAFWASALIVILELAGCRGGSPMPAVSPLSAPLTTISPIATGTPTPLLGADFDLSRAVLVPEDLADVLQASYSVSQPYQRAGVRGIQVVYPTKVIEHTSGFVEGFASQVEVYDQEAGAVEAFKTAVAGLMGQPFAMRSMGDETHAQVLATANLKEVPLDAPEADNFAYVVIVRKSNALAIITLKVPKALPAAKLEPIVDAVVQRLTPSPR